MSLRLRLFLLFGGLVASLVVAQWWWVRVVTRDLSSEIDQVASSVGRSVVAFFKDFSFDADAGPHHRLIGCLGDDCKDVTLEGADVELADHEPIPPSAMPSSAMPSSAMPSSAMPSSALRASAGGAGGEQSSAANTPADTTVVIHRLHQHGSDDATGEDPAGLTTYSYRFEGPGPGNVSGSSAAGSSAAGSSAAGSATASLSGSTERVERRVMLHVEHQDEARYLRMGTPSMERRIRIPQGFRQKLDRLSRRLFFGSAGFLALGLVLAGVVAHRVTTPLRRLSDAARQLGEGALGTRVSLAATGEVGEAISAFNHMSGRLEELDRRTRELSARKHLGEIGEIARGLAHTLRNPLNALGLSVEELAALADGGSADQLAESARRQIRRIDSSLKSFLALASQSGGVLDEVDLSELIEDVCLEALQDGRGKARLELALAEGLPRPRAVEPELRAMLQALVVNAIEASPEGGRVTVRSASPAMGRWRLEIDDQGPGLPQDVRSRLFTPHLSTKANGSGMGLFLAHRIATSRYGGSLELVDRESENGAILGTRVILELGEWAGAEGGHGAGSSPDSRPPLAEPGEHIGGHADV